MVGKLQDHSFHVLIQFMYHFLVSYQNSILKLNQNVYHILIFVIQHFFKLL